MQLVALVIALLLWPSWAGAATLFEATWEDVQGALGVTWGTSSCSFITSVGAPDYPEGCNPFRSTARVFAGAKSLEKDYTGPIFPGGDNNHGVFITRFFTGQTDLYLRFFSRIEGYSTCDASSCIDKMFYLFQPNLNSGPSLVFSQCFGQMCVGSQGESSTTAPCSGATAPGPFNSCNYYPNMNVGSGSHPQNQWACIEAHYRANTVVNGVVQADGILEMWRDGVQFMNYTNRTWSGVGQAYAPQLGTARIYTQSGKGKHWFDNFAIGNTRIGCGAAPPVDATAPSVPTAVFVDTPTANSLVIHWTKGVDAESGVSSNNIYRCINAGCTLTALLTTVGDVNSYTDTSLNSSQAYGYQVQAVSIGGPSLLSSPVAYGTTSAPTGGGAATTPTHLQTFTVDGTTPYTATLQIPFTVGSGSNIGGFACLVGRHSSTEANTYPTSVNHDGATPWTFVRRDTRVLSGAYRTTSIWKRAGITGGGHTLNATFPGAPDLLQAGAVSIFKDVDQTTPVEADNGANGTGNPFSASVTSVSDHAVIWNCTWSGDPLTAVSSPMIELVRTTVSPGAVVDGLGVSMLSDKSPAGAQSVQWSQQTSQTYALGAIAIKPTPGFVPGPPEVVELHADVAGFSIVFGGGTLGSAKICTIAGCFFVQPSAFVSGRYQHPWLPGQTWVCVTAISVAGVENTTGNQPICDGIPPILVPGGAIFQSPINTRYFTDQSGRALWLVGVTGDNRLWSMIKDNNLSGSTVLRYPVEYPDNFNRAALGADYTGYSGASAMTIFGSTQLRASTSNALNSARLSAFYPNNSQFAEGTIAVNVAGAFQHNLSLGLRRTNSTTNADGYAAIFSDSNTVGFGKTVGGSFTQLGSNISYSTAAGKRFRFTAIGTTLSVYDISGATPVFVGSQTDSTFHEGYCGLGIFLASGEATTEAAWDDFSCGTVRADYAAAMTGIAAEGLNYVRIWAGTEQTRWGNVADFTAGTFSNLALDMMPWLLTGTRTVSVGGRTITTGVYNTDQFGTKFFTRLNDAVTAAGDAGLYSSIMLFSGGLAFYYDVPSCTFDPFCTGNNTNGINVDANADGRPYEAHTLANAAVTARQDAYVCKVVETIGDREKIFFEVSNEDPFDVSGATTAWQNHIAQQVHTCEQALGKPRHEVYITPYNFGGGFPANNNYLLNNTNANVVAIQDVGGLDLKTNPPANNTTSPAKILIIDTDHLQVQFGAGMDAKAPWRAFARANYFHFLDNVEAAPLREDIKQAMADTRIYADKMDLINMVPDSGTLISSTFGLVKACAEYFMYQPSAGTHSINLSACDPTASFSVEYFSPVSRTTTTDANVLGGASRSFVAAGERVVYLKNVTAPPVPVPPVVSGCQPTGPLPAGSTDGTITCLTDVQSICRVSSTDTTWAAMPFNSMASIGGLSHTQVTPITGLTDGSSADWYVRCNLPSGLAPNPESTVVTVAVEAAPGDTTDPDQVTGLVCSSITTLQNFCHWDPGNDPGGAVKSYELWDSLDDVNFVLAASPVIPEATVGIAQGSTHYYKARTVDTANRKGPFSSPSVQVIGPSDPPPSNNPPVVGACTVDETLTTSDSVTFNCPVVVDTIGIALYRFETCIGLNCTNFGVAGIEAVPTFVAVRVPPETMVRLRVKAENKAHFVSPDYGPIAQGMTLPKRVRRGFCECDTD